MENVKSILTGTVIGFILIIILYRLSLLISKESKWESKIDLRKRITELEKLNYFLNVRVKTFESRNKDQLHAMNHLSHENDELYQKLLVQAIEIEELKLLYQNPLSRMNMEVLEDEMLGKVDRSESYPPSNTIIQSKDIEFDEDTDSKEQLRRFYSQSDNLDPDFSRT